MPPNKENRVAKVNSKPTAAQNVTCSNRRPPVLPPPPGAIRLFGSIRHLWNAIVPVIRNPKPATLAALPASPSSPALSLALAEEEDLSEINNSKSDLSNSKAHKVNPHLRPSVTFDVLPSYLEDRNSSPTQHPQPVLKRSVSTSTSHPRSPRVDTNTNPSSKLPTTTRQFRRETPATVPPRRISERIAGPDNSTKGDFSSNNAMTSTRNTLSSSDQGSLLRKSASLVSPRYVQPSSPEGDQVHQPHVLQGQSQRGKAAMMQPEKSLLFGFRQKDRSDGLSSLEVSDVEGDSQWRARRGRKPTVREIIAEGRAAERAAKEKVQLNKLKSSRGGSATKDVEHVRVERRTNRNTTERRSHYGKQNMNPDVNLVTVGGQHSDAEGANLYERAENSPQIARSRQSKSRLLERGRRWKDKIRDGRSKQKQSTVNQMARSLPTRSSSRGMNVEQNRVQQLDPNTGPNDEVTSGSSSQRGQRLGDLFEEGIRESDLSPVVRPSTGDNDLQDVWRIRLASYTRRMIEDGSRSILSAPPSPKGGGTMILSRIESPVAQGPVRGYGAADNTTSSPVCMSCLYKALNELPGQNPSESSRGSLGSPVTECGLDRTNRSKLPRRNIKTESSTGGRVDQLYRLVTQLREQEQWKSLQETSQSKHSNKTLITSRSGKSLYHRLADGSQSR